MHGQTDNVKTVYPLQTKFAGGIINKQDSHIAIDTTCILRRRVSSVCFDSLRPSQQFSSHVGTGLPGLNQY